MERLAAKNDLRLFDSLHRNALAGTGLEALPIELVKWDHPDVELRIPNVDKARDMLGFAPQVDLEEGLLRTISWYRRSLRG